MKILEGNPISPGYAIGISIICDYEIERRIEVPLREISLTEVEAECDRLDDALEQSKRDLTVVRQTGFDSPKLADAAALLSAHAAMASEIAALVKERIGSELVNVEQALDSVIGEWVAKLNRLDDDFLRDREQDVRDVGRRMTRNLSGALPGDYGSLPPGSVVVARELLPSEAAELANSGVVAIIAEHGGIYSHTAIVARALGIPAITGIPKVTSRIRAGTRLLVDGEYGSVVVHPAESDEQSFSKRKREYERLSTAIASQEKLPSVTRDRVEIALLANVGLPEEIGHVNEHNLVGVGLFRTEFLFLKSHLRPDFETQFQMYGSMARDLEGQPLVVRTFDLGGDKLPPFLLQDEAEKHVPLHLRGLRFSLAEQSLLDAQLRAIIQVAQSSDVRILFPMVIGGDDFERALAAVDNVVDQLQVLQRPYVGAMIETPAALFALDEILGLADFVAIGTNDLTQYMLAADRDLAEGTDDCTAMHPVVLRAIKQVVEAAERWKCPVCVCGEQAGEVGFAYLLIGLGIRELSLSADRAAAIRRMIRQTDSQQARQVADEALCCRSPGEVRELLSRVCLSEATTGSGDQVSLTTTSGNEMGGNE